jgi:hypothetical protein
MTSKILPTKVPTVRVYLRLVTVCKLLKNLEAAIGIEPMNKGFAEIFSYHSQKDTEDQVGARTTR